MADLLSQLIFFPVIRQELIEFFVIVGLDSAQDICEPLQFMDPILLAGRHEGVHCGSHLCGIM
jgi:hypothetical protein